MGKSVWLLILVAQVAGSLLTLSSESAAGTPVGGTIELGLSGNVDGVKASVDTDQSTESRTTEWSGQAALTLGVFLSRIFEIGITPIYVSRDEPGAARFSGFVSAHVPMPQDSKVIPFIGGQAGTSVNVYRNRNPFQWGFFGGVKAFVADGAAITVEPYYLRETIDYLGNDTGPDSFTYSSFGVRTGVSVFFGSSRR